MASSKKITGVIFTDSGQAASFMGLDWVQRVIRERVGFAPHPGTLNLRLESSEGMELWKDLRMSMKGIDIPPDEPSFCHARCFLARIDGPSKSQLDSKTVAVLVPEVDNYPPDKIEVIAPFHVKKTLDLKDGDQLTLEFIGE